MKTSKDEQDKRNKVLNRAKQTLNLENNDSKDSKETLKEAEHLENLQDMSKRTGSGNFTPEELEGVKDMDSYRKWRKLRKLPILNEHRKIKCTDGSTIDLAWFPAYLESRIKHLPPMEIQSIMKSKEIYQKMHLTANKFKLKAYGYQFQQKIRERKLNKSREIGFIKSKSADLIELFGRMFTIEEVHQVVVEEWKFPASYNDIVEFKKNNLAVIVEKQEIHKREYSDLRLVQKRSRLEELTHLYNKLRDKIKTTTNREDIKVMKDILTEVRKEVEGEKLVLSGGLDLNIEANINVHLQREVFKEFSLTQIIVGRVASRMNIASSRIIEGLQNSYYARFNRFLGNEPEDVDFEEMEYPSQAGYDFEKIAVKHREEVVLTKQKKQELRVEETKATLRVEQSNLKESLLAKIREKTGDVKRDKLKIGEEELKRLKSFDKNKLKDND